MLYTTTSKLSKRNLVASIIHVRCIRRTWYLLLGYYYTGSFESFASKGFPSGCSKNMCVRPPTLRKLRTYDVDLSTIPEEHPPTPTPCRWPALITLPSLAKLQLAWRRLCDVLLVRSSCLFEHTLTACLLYTSDAADE